jgi:DNA (cytosine-5)-methyltransferase 1
MNVLDLFSGIGGFSLGLERAGMRTVAFCEANDFCRRVLAHHWPNTPIFTDVRSLTAQRLAANGIAVDLIAGGFPCQDVSQAGRGAGLDGERSGLWHEFARLIRELRPDWVIAENVPGLRALGADRVLDDLEAADYTARPLVVGAWHAGAPHRRNRVWIVANAKTVQWTPITRDQSNRTHALATADADEINGQPRSEERRPSDQGGEIASRLGAWGAWNGGPPDLSRMDDGIPKGLAESALGAFGNTLLPQIPEIIGRAIMRASMVTSQERNAP